jgi:hypothetical protein
MNDFPTNRRRFICYCVRIQVARSRTNEPPVTQIMTQATTKLVVAALPTFAGVFAIGPRAG